LQLPFALLSFSVPPQQLFISNSETSRKEQFRMCIMAVYVTVQKLLRLFPLKFCPPPLFSLLCPMLLLPSTKAAGRYCLNSHFGPRWWACWAGRIGGTLVGSEYFRFVVEVGVSALCAIPSTKGPWIGSFGSIFAALLPQAAWGYRVWLCTFFNSFDVRTFVVAVVVKEGMMNR
jgi:hypothetical protein